MAHELWSPSVVEELIVLGHGRCLSEHLPTIYRCRKGQIKYNIQILNSLQLYYHQVNTQTVLDHPAFNPNIYGLGTLIHEHVDASSACSTSCLLKPTPTRTALILLSMKFRKSEHILTSIWCRARFSPYHEANRVPTGIAMTCLSVQIQKQMSVRF